MKNGSKNKSGIESARVSGRRSRGAMAGGLSGVVFALAAAVAPVAVSAQVGTLKDGSIVAWGAGESGQLAVPSGNFTQLAGGGLHGLALRADGTLTGWGNNVYGQIAFPGGTFTQVAAGRYHSVAIRTDGFVAAWGDNTFNTATISVAGVFASVGTGQYNTYGVRHDGSLGSFGSNNFGANTPPSGTYRSAVGGGFHGVALRTDDSVVAWGYDFYGQTSGTPVSGTYTAVAADFGTSYALRSDSTIAAWGINAATAPTDSGYVAISGSNNGIFALGLRADGTLNAWGDNSSGQTSFPAGVYTAVAAGERTSWALRGQTAYAGDLRIFGTGPTANLNRSVTVAGNATIESSVSIYNRSTLTVGGNLTIHTGADVSYDGAVSVGGSVRITRASGNFFPNSVSLYSPVTAAGPLAGDGDVYLGSSSRYQFGLTQNPAYSGDITLAGGATLAFSGMGLQSCSAFNNYGGTVRLSAGQALSASTFSVYNAGTVLLNPASTTTGVAELSAQGIFTNDINGVINARNALISSGQGLTNAGGIAFTGGSSDVLGKVTNAATGNLTITAGASVVFSDDVVQNGTFVIRRLGTVTSSAVFLGAFTGAGGFTGGGTAYIEGDLAPGNSPAAVNYGGDVALGPTARTIIELGGTTPGLEYDRLVVTGEFALAGTLDLRFIDGFSGTPHPFTYEVISAGSLTGAFDNVLFPDETGGWLIYRTETTLSVGRFAVVPEPTGAAVLAAALPLATRRRRR